MHPLYRDTHLKLFVYSNYVKRDQHGNEEVFVTPYAQVIASLKRVRLVFLDIQKEWVYHLSLYVPFWWTYTYSICHIEMKIKDKIGKHYKSKYLGIFHCMTVFNADNECSMFSELFLFQKHNFNGLYAHFDLLHNNARLWEILTDNKFATISLKSRSSNVPSLDCVCWPLLATS